MDTLKRLCLLARAVRCLSLASRFSDGLLYADRHVLVFNKPSGVLSQADRTGDACVNALAAAYVLKERGTKYAVAVHRLDRPTSGAIVVATTSKASSRLSRSFREGLVDKTYVVVLDNAYNLLDEGFLSSDIKKAKDAHRYSRQQLVRTVAHHPPSEGEAHGEASLRYRVIETTKSQAVASVTLLTGKRHQIRAQFAALGSPVFGDLKYGHSSSDRRICSAIPLHSARIVLPHPIGTNPPLDVVAPLPIENWTSSLRIPRKLAIAANDYLSSLGRT